MSSTKKPPAKSRSPRLSVYILVAAWGLAATATRGTARAAAEAPPQPPGGGVIPPPQPWRIPPAPRRPGRILPLFPALPAPVPLPSLPRRPSQPYSGPWPTPR